MQMRVLPCSGISLFFFEIYKGVFYKCMCKIYCSLSLNTSQSFIVFFRRGLSSFLKTILDNDWFEFLCNSDIWLYKTQMFCIFAAWTTTITSQLKLYWYITSLTLKKIFLFLLPCENGTRQNSTCDRQLDD